MKVYFCHPWLAMGTRNKWKHKYVVTWLLSQEQILVQSQEGIKRIQYELNERPRKTLDWKSPLDVFYQGNIEEMLLSFEECAKCV